MITKVNTANFAEEVLNSEIPVLVDFFAVWCGPCKMVSPVIDSLAEDLDGKVKVCKLDIDQSMDIAIKYHVMSVPTLMLFKDGDEARRVSGAMPKEMILSEFEEFF